MRLSVPLAVILTCTLLLSQSDVAPDELTKPFDWPMLASSDAGLQFFLRTRWADGVLQYVVTLADGKGRLARWFSKHPDTGPVPLSSFQTTFSDEAGFRIYTIIIDDRTFSKIEGTKNYEATGERRCTEKIYRAMLIAVKATNGTDKSSHGFNYPTGLTAVAPPRKR